MKEIEEDGLQKNEAEKKEQISDKDIAFYAIVFFAILSFGFLFCLVFWFGFFAGLLNWLTSEVRLLTGCDKYLAEGIAFILMAILFCTPLGGCFWSLFPIPQKHKKEKRLIFLLVLATFFFAAYFTSRDVYFSPDTGEPVKYYSVGPDGEYRISSSEGYDPVTGEKLKPVDKKVATENYFGESSRNLSGKRKTKPLSIDNADSWKTYEKVYAVEFKNEQKRSIFLCFTDGHTRYEGVGVILIPAGRKVRVKLSEGLHFLDFLDTELNEYGFRDGGKILCSSCTADSDKIHLKVDGREKIVNQEFSFQVSARKDQKISLKEDGFLACNIEKTENQNNQYYIAVFLICVILMGLTYVTPFIIELCKSETRASSVKK